jgi:drug/metabolite transporter (DMT)-like permease
MILAMLVMPLVDGLAKHLSASYSPLFLGWARYAVASAVVLPFGASRRGHPFFPTEQRTSHGLRTVFLVAAMTLYFLAVARIPLATAVSAFFVGPIVAVVLSVFVLGERMTSRKALALISGVVGWLVILRPGASTDPGILLAFGSGALFALYLVATRRAAAASDPVPTLVFQCVAGTLLLTPQAVLSWRTPAWSDAPFFLALGALSATSHFLSIAAFRRCEASTLAPLVYVELVGAVLVGYSAFGELPGATTVVGAGLSGGEPPRKTERKCIYPSSFRHSTRSSASDRPCSRWARGSRSRTSTPRSSSSTTAPATGPPRSSAGG